MSFKILFVIFIVVIGLNYVLLDIKVHMLKNEIIEKDKLISAFVVLDKAIKKLNNGFKDHERRLDNVEELLLYEYEEPKASEYTCKDCKFCDLYNGIGFTNAVKYFRCKKTGCSNPLECDKVCEDFEKKEGHDEDENVVYYANNMKVDISSKKPGVYKPDRMLTYEEYLDRISRLFLVGGISYADMNALLEMFKQ